MFKNNSGKDTDTVRFEFIQPHGENAKDAYLIKVKSKNDSIRFTAKSIIDRLKINKAIV